MEEAAFATVGAVALNGFRRSDADVGATVAVVGLGLIGQLCVRVARAAGCRVIGVDLDDDLLRLAEVAGAEPHLRSDIQAGSRVAGEAHAVLVCASSRDNDPVELAALLAADRGVVVVVGDVVLEVPRAAYYEKELDLRLARSYGPGRYDPQYEVHGLDYPEGFVRWTEQRNMQAFLRLVAKGDLRPSEIVTHRFAFGDAERAFEILESERPVAIALAYDGDNPEVSRPSVADAVRPRRRTTQGMRFGLIGAGRFATGTLLPGILDAGFVPVVVTSAGGLSAVSAQRRFGFELAVSDSDDVFSRDDLDLVVIATRHDSHADLVARALRSGLPVYVEKPLALDWSGLRAVHDAQRHSGASLLVGFNRRHAPLACALAELSGPRMMSYRVNAGPLEPGHWLNDPERGGGRLKGEGCHFIDFLCWQAASDPVRAFARGFASRPDLALEATDNFAVQIDFADGGVGSVLYSADAPTTAGKERFETSAPGAFGSIDDFRDGEIWRGSKRERLRVRGQNKGFKEQFAQLARILRGDEQPPDPSSFYLSTLATLAAARSLGSGNPEPIVAAAATQGDAIG
jgi:predicted dehydrogenase